MSENWINPVAMVAMMPDNHLHHKKRREEGNVRRMKEKNKDTKFTLPAYYTPSDPADEAPADDYRTLLKHRHASAAYR